MLRPGSHCALTHETSTAYPHPHPDAYHVMWWYRRHIMRMKKSVGYARGLIHYDALVVVYKAAKRVVIQRRKVDPTYTPETTFPPEWKAPKLVLTPQIIAKIR